MAKKGKSRKGGPKMSKVKMKNIKGKKLGTGKKTKSKDITLARRKLQRAVRKKLANKGSTPKEPEAVIEDVLDMIPSDDLPHLRRESFKNTFYMVNGRKGDDEIGEERQRRKRKHVSNKGEEDDLEAEYEDRFMRAKERNQNEKQLLPIKTGKGLHYPTASAVEDVPELEEPSPQFIKSATSAVQSEEIEAGVHTEVTTAMLLARRSRKFAEYKVKIGILSSAFLEDPENRLQNLESLLALMETSEASIAISVPKLVALSLQAIFKDVLPLYPIKHHNDDGVKLKKDTRQLQGFESSLLKKYRMYLQRLEKLVARYCPKRSSLSLSEVERKLGKIALSCMCGMLESHPYFNLSVNIVNFIVPLLNNWDVSVRDIVIRTVKAVFKMDKRGEISYEIVRRINIMVRSICTNGKAQTIRTDVLDVLLALRIKEADLAKEKEEEALPGRKMTFEQRKMLSKRQRKKAKELVQLERELLEASAEENKTRKCHFMTEITKLLFTIYFRTLKTAPSPNLLSSVLEGLSKFAHVINVDFFEDLLKVLQGLLMNTELRERHVLLCISTVLAVLDGQGAALTLDPSAFHKQLYSTLANIRCGNLESNVSVCLRCVRMATGRNKMPGPRAVAVAKRLATMALQTEHHDAVGILQQLKHILRLHASSSVLLDCEGAGASGLYLPELEDPDHCCAQSSTLWELVPLMSHYHPWVRNVATGIVQPEKTDQLPGSIAQQTPEVLAESLNDTVKAMEFNPKLKTPVTNPGARNKNSRSNFFTPKTSYFQKDLDVKAEAEFRVQNDALLVPTSRF